MDPEFTSENGEVLGLCLQTQPKNEAVILHWCSSYHEEHPDCPLVFASIAIACPGVTFTLFSTTSSGVREAHGTTDDTGVFSSTCKLGGEAASIARGLQSFARITVATLGETQALYKIDESVPPIQVAVVQGMPDTSCVLPFGELLFLPCTSHMCGVQALSLHLFTLKLQTNVKMMLG